MAIANDSAPALRIVESDELSLCLVVSRPRRPGQVLVVTSPDLTGLQLMMFANVLLAEPERNQLADWLEVHRGAGRGDEDPPLITRPHDWPPDKP